MAASGPEAQLASSKADRRKKLRVNESVPVQSTAGPSQTNQQRHQRPSFDSLVPAQLMRVPELAQLHLESLVPGRRVISGSRWQLAAIIACERAGLASDAAALSCEYLTEHGANVRVKGLSWQNMHHIIHLSGVAASDLRRALQLFLFGVPSKKTVANFLDRLGVKQLLARSGLDEGRLRALLDEFKWRYHHRDGFAAPPKPVPQPASTRAATKAPGVGKTSSEKKGKQVARLLGHTTGTTHVSASIQASTVHGSDETRIVTPYRVPNVTPSPEPGVSLSKLFVGRRTYAAIFWRFDHRARAMLNDLFAGAPNGLPRDALILDVEGDPTPQQLNVYEEVKYIGTRSSLMNTKAISTIAFVHHDLPFDAPEHVTFFRSFPDGTMVRWNTSGLCVALLLAMKGHSVDQHGISFANSDYDRKVELAVFHLANVSTQPFVESRSSPTPAPLLQYAATHPPLPAQGEHPPPVFIVLPAAACLPVADWLRAPSIVVKEIEFMGLMQRMDLAIDYPRWSVVTWSSFWQHDINGNFVPDVFPYDEVTLPSLEFPDAPPEVCRAFEKLRTDLPFEALIVRGLGRVHQDEFPGGLARRDDNNLGGPGLGGPGQGGPGQGGPGASKHQHRARVGAKNEGARIELNEAEASAIDWVEADWTLVRNYIFNIASDAKWIIAPRPYRASPTSSAALPPSTLHHDTLPSAPYRASAASSTSNTRQPKALVVNSSPPPESARARETLVIASSPPPEQLAPSPRLQKTVSSSRPPRALANGLPRTAKRAIEVVELDDSSDSE